MYVERCTSSQEGVRVYHCQQMLMGSCAQSEVGRPLILGDGLLPPPQPPLRVRGPMSQKRGTLPGVGQTRESGCPDGSNFSRASRRAGPFSLVPCVARPPSNPTHVLF